MAPFERKFVSFGQDLGSFTVVDEHVVRSVNNGPDVQTPLETRYRVTVQPDTQLGVPIFPGETTWSHEPEADLDEFSFKLNESGGSTMRAVGSRVSCDDRSVVFWTPGVLPNYGIVEERNGMLGTTVTLYRQISAEGVEFQPFIAK
jgi:hypothetical protein